MTPDRRTVLLGSGALTLGARVARAEADGPLPDAAIAAILERRIARRQGVGMVVGVIEPGRRRIVGRGQLSTTDARVPAGGTVFGIASLSKPFTALLLADAVERGELALDRPLAEYLPKGAQLPQSHGRQITLLDIATHTAGMPHELPDEEQLAARTKGRVAAKVALYDYLAAYRPATEPGAAWSYSNLDYTLIADCLSERTGLDYGTLVARRIAEPLGLTSTAVVLTAAMRAHRASPHTADLQPAPEWSKPWSPAPIQTTADDLLTFLAAFLGHFKTPLAPAMAAMLRPRRPAPTIGADQALGWQVAAMRGGLVIGHGGGGGGFASSAVYDPAAGVGVVVLSNAEILQEDLSRHVLRPSLPLNESPQSILLDDGVLDRLVGTYRDAAGALTIVRREPRGLLLVMPAGYKAPLTAQGPTRFFVQGYAGLTAEFEVDAAGRASAIAWTLAGNVTRGHRVEP
jgi:serine-type D-Ala-D-Ala carboxypeptidase/endopeptidase